MTGPPMTPQQIQPPTNGLTPHDTTPLEQMVQGTHQIPLPPHGAQDFLPATPDGPASLSGMLNTPGGGMLQLPPGLGQDFLALPNLSITTQGLTPDAQSMVSDETQQQQIEDPQARKKAMKAIYGDDFPLILDHQPQDSDWYRWVENRWTLHRPGMQHNIWMAERNRQFRAGYQYQSRVNSMGAWRETPTPRDSVRIVDNRIRPALAWILQVLQEQRPGWQFKPTNTDADRERKADAQQRAVEYQYDAQKKRLIDREAVYWAQTDGASFQMTFLDPDLGPWEELEQGKGPVPMGEPNTRVFRLEQVVVSSEATSTVKPMYWLVRDILPMQYAVSLYGPEVADAPDQALLAQQSSQFSTTNQYAYAPLYQNQMTVARYFVFCDKRDWLPEGLTAIVVGRKIVFGPKPLIMGKVPMTRITDGSEDPAFFPVPRMNLLIAPQMRINMLKSKFYESIRKNSGGRFATKSGAVSAETFIGGETSMLDVRTSGPISDAIMPIQGFSVGGDIKEALADEIQQIEDITGYTKEARGQFSSDQSGRAILAQRETLERAFAPQVGALAEANTEWAEQMVGWMRFAWQRPRMVAVLGNNRSDLAMELSAADMDGICDVTVDPSTMIPKPQALRQWEIDNAYDRKLIGPDEWRERSQFGNDRDIQTPNVVAYAKAKRISEQLRLQQSAEPLVWQDNEHIIQTVLERDLILAGGIDPQIQQAAQQYWQKAADQAKGKMTPPPPQPGTPAGDYALFIQTIVNDAKGLAESLIAKTTMQLVESGGAAQPGMAPGGPAVPGLPTPTPRPPSGPTSNRPPVGHAMNPRIAPLMGGNPSAGGQSPALGGPGVSPQEGAAARFEQRSIA